MASVERGGIEVRPLVVDGRAATDLKAASIENLSDPGTLVVAALVNNLSSKTWLSGMSSALEAANDPDRYLDSFLSRTAGAIVVPSIVAQIAKESDPLVREARNPIDRIRSRIPGLSQGLNPRRDVFGRPVEQQDAIGPDLISPLFTGKDKGDPTIAALIESGARLSPPSRSYKVDGKSVDWSPGQYDELQKLVGASAKPQLDALVASPVWGWMEEDDKKAEVQSVMKKARGNAKSQILQALSVPPAKGASPVASTLVGAR